MKKISIFILFLATSIYFSSCGNRAKTALDEAVQSQSITMLRQFLINYPKADAELIDYAKQVLNNWVEDSTAFAGIKKIQQKDNIVERYNAELSYIDNYPNGLYITEVKAMYEKDEPEATAIIERAEAIRSHLDWYKAKFSNYAFINNQNKLASYVVMLTAPDEDGKGEGVYSWSSLEFFFYYSINLENLDDSDLHCTMYTHDGQESHFNIRVGDNCIYWVNNGKYTLYVGQWEENVYNTFIKKSVPKIKGKKYRNIDTSWW